MLTTTTTTTTTTTPTSIPTPTPTRRVRLRFVMLLQRVSTVRSMKFFQIVPVDHLMGRLAADASRPAMCSAMTKLLAPSYFPQVTTSTSTVTLTLTLTLTLNYCKLLAPSYFPQVLN